MATATDIYKAQGVLIDRNLAIFDKNNLSRDDYDRIHRNGRAIDRLAERLRGVTWDDDEEDDVGCDSCGRTKGHSWQCPVLKRITDDVVGKQLR
jgi:hypothetical protein